MTQGAGRGRLGALFYRQQGDPLAQSHLESDLGRRTARGAVSTVTTQWAQFVITTSSTIVLARLLTPSAFGIAAMVTALIGIGDAFWNLGLQTATIRYKVVTHAQVTFFFWLQVGLGLILTAITMGAAHLVASFYHNQKVIAVTLAYASYFVISGSLAQHQAVLTRQMRFTLLAVIDAFAMAVGFVVGIVVALLDHSYWAIVASAQTTLVVRLVLYWWTSGWVPGPPRRTPGVFPMIRFGLNLALTNILDYLGGNADNILIGHAYGSATLGLYSRAYNLLMMPVNQIHQPMARIAVPVLSYLQDQPERFRKYFRTAVSAVAYLAMPLITTVAALAHETITIVLGRQWIAAAPLFQVLAIAGTINILRNPNGWVFTSLGRAGRQSTWALINRPIMILGFVVGLKWGAIGVAWSYTATNLLLYIPGTLWAVKDSPLGLADIWHAGWRPLSLSLATFGAAFACHEGMKGLPPEVVAAAGFAAAGVIMVGAVRYWPAVHADVRTLRDALSRKSPSPSDRAAAATEAPQAEDVPATKLAR